MLASSYFVSRLTLAALLLLVGSCSRALAQAVAITSGAGISNPLNDVTNPIGMLQRAMAQRELMAYAAIADRESERFRAAGQARIDAGQASTTFRRATGPIAPARFGAQAPNPADRQAWTEEYARGLDYFEFLAKTNKVNLNDVADGWGLAFTVAFETYSGGQSPTAAHRRSYTEATRNNLMHNPRFQTYTDQERQLLFELYGMNAATAAIQSIKADETGNRAMRDQARQFARNTLASLWPYPVEGLELTSTGFEDRGLRLIREGKATEWFTPSPSPLVTDPQQRQLWLTFVQYTQTRKIPMGDLSGTLGECVLINWEIANGGRPLTRQQYIWTFAGMKQMLLTNPAWQRMSDTEKQRSLESFAIKTMAVSAEYQQASRPVTEHLSGPLLAGAKANGIDEASLRLKRMDIVSFRALANLDSFFPPKFAQYTLNENGFVLANAAKR